MHRGEALVRSVHSSPRYHQYFFQEVAGVDRFCRVRQRMVGHGAVSIPHKQLTTRALSVMLIGLVWFASLRFARTRITCSRSAKRL